MVKSGIQGEKLLESVRVGNRGAIVLSAKLRKRLGIEEGSIVVAEEKGGGILIRPVIPTRVERYSPERKAEFLLSTATTNADYRKARRVVRKLGVDPDSCSPSAIVIVTFQTFGTLMPFAWANSFASSYPAST